MVSLAKRTRTIKLKHLEVSADTAQVAGAEAAAASSVVVEAAAPRVVPAQELGVAARPRPQEPSSETWWLLSPTAALPT